jgi:hypothetical protein
MVLGSEALLKKKQADSDSNAALDKEWVLCRPFYS